MDNNHLNVHALRIPASICQYVFSFLFRQPNRKNNRQKKIPLVLSNIWNFCRIILRPLRLSRHISSRNIRRQIIWRARRFSSRRLRRLIWPSRHFSNNNSKAKSIPDTRPNTNHNTADNRISIRSRTFQLYFRNNYLNSNFTDDSCHVLSKS